MALPRLRQVAFAATDLDAVAGRLRSTLGLDEPYADEGVGLFGLRNAVFAVGDCFLEVVSPVQPGTAAGRYLERQGGDAGYMAMVQVDDASAARERLKRLAVRVVWDFAGDDIVDLHLHPKDVPGTLLALDQAEPAGSWRWGGPSWTATVPPHPAGGLTSVTIAAADPDAAVHRWCEVLDATPTGRIIPLNDGQQIHFTEIDGRDGIVALTLTVPDPVADGFDIAGVRIDLLSA